MSNSSPLAASRALLRLLERDLDAKTLEDRQLKEALTELKVLGREAKNVSPIYDATGMNILGSYAFGRVTPAIRQEALRCIANALLLLPSTRKFCLGLGLDAKAADAFREAGNDEEFLLARILFLLTYDPDIDLATLLADHGMAETIVSHLARHSAESKEATLKNPLGPGGVALQETLKLLFNVTSAKAGRSEKFNVAVIELFEILSHSEIPSPPLQPPISLIVNALANLEVDEKTLGHEAEIRTATEKLLTILEQSLAYHSSTDLDTVAVPLLTVFRNINAAAGLELREVLKTTLLPNDEERDQPLGKSSSVASQLLRLTTSSGTLNLSEAISGLMFELSDKDANEYVKNVGYGYAAGYLMSHKIPIPESVRTSQPGGESSRQIPINPITGQRLDKEPVSDLPEMTQEEKEREAERLFVLFERLKATGVVDVKNPVEQARDEARFEELSDSDHN